jgi:pyruvate dehydrogenase E2 component (dihydrolipoamide acetyltransferase)
MTPVVMPQVGENLTSGVVVEWLKNEGDVVARREVLAIVESEKAAFEVIASAGGTLLKILRPAGQQVDVLTTIACIGEAGEIIDLDALAAEGPKSGSQTSTLDAASTATPTTSSSSVTSSSSGRPTLLTPSGRPTVGTTETVPGHTLRGRPFASPSARRLARELLVDLRGVDGSGPAGRVIRRDILAAALRACGGSPRPESVVALPEPVVGPGDRLVRHTRLRQIVASRMSSSARLIPHFYLVADIDVGEARQWLQELADDGVGLTDIIVAAVARALRKFERLNAHVGEGGIVCKADVHIGLAVAVEDGVLVPALSHVDHADLATLGNARRQITAQARRGIVQPDPASTFTVSNLGPMGVSRFLPLINPPECAILAIGVAEERVVAREGRPTIREMLTVTLACDHRAVDGAYAAEFLAHFTQILEAAREYLVDVETVDEPGE